MWRWLWLLCACGRIGFSVDGDAGRGADTSPMIDGAPGQDAALDQGLVGWWKLDETSGASAADASPSGVIGTLKMGPVWQPVARIGGGLQFTAPGQYVDLGIPPALTNLAPLTATAWVFIPTVALTGVDQCIFDKGAGTSGWFFDVSHLAPGDLNFQHATAPGTYVSRASGPALVAGTWQHVAVTWDGGVASVGIGLYVNGIELSYSDATEGTNVPGDDTAIYMGINCVGPTNGLIATMDDVRLYNRVLTPFEIGVLAAQ
jgi:hypothetical protein